MESLLDDIRENRSLNLIQQLKSSLFDCAKNLKSNDETFNISTFPIIRDRFSDLMSQYVDSVQALEASQRAFMQLQEYVADDDQDPNGGEPVDLHRFKVLFDQTIDQELKDRVTSETEAQTILNALINVDQQKPPQQGPDEEIYLEQTTNREIPKDPITKKNIKIAVRSKKCNHVYDQESIKNFIELRTRNNSRIQCPVAGCSNRAMKLTELVLDDATNALIASLV